MRLFRRCCSALCVCLLLSIAFSTSVSAETVETPQSLNIVQVSSVYNSSISNDELNVTFEFSTNNGVTEKDSTSTRALAYNADKFLNVKHNYFITADNESVLISKGNEVDLKIERFPFAIKHKSGNDSNFIYTTLPTQVRLLLYYTDGSMQYVDDVSFVNTSNSYISNITCSFTPTKDIFKLELITVTSVPFGTVTIYHGESDGTQEGFYLIVDQHTKSEGLLASIIEWLKGIKDGITNLFNSIAELPQKIWSFIENGLKSLFVPDDEFIITFKDDIDAMLENKLGAVYQVVNILTESWDRITANDTANTINIPVTSINLPEGNTFSFGGYDVAIVPQGFNWLVDIIKTLIGIACTILFVNGLRKKYDEVMGVEQ